MFERVKFSNHINETLQFGEKGIYANYNELHDYKWAYQSENGRISLFERGIANKKLPVVIICGNKEEGIDIKNKLMEYAEKDVLVNVPGTLTIGDYYMKCFIIGSSKSNYLIDKRYMEVTLEILTDQPVWIKETKNTFLTGNVQTLEQGKSNLDYPYDHPYDYATDVLLRKLTNTGYAETNFRIVFYGECENPKCYIGKNLYEVFVSLEKGEYLTIDSKKKTIVLTHRDGREENCFKKRNRDHYIFQKIPPGESDVTWDGDYGFDIFVIEERSEPKWT